MRKRYRNSFIRITLATICMLLFCFIYFFSFHTKHPALDQNARAWTASAASDQPGQIQIPGYGEIIFKANEATQQITLYNPEGNPCYFTFSLSIDEDEEILYESGMVEPGKAIEAIQLTHPLPEGDYQLNIHINTFDLDTETPLNGAISTARLRVQ